MRLGWSSVRTVGYSLQPGHCSNKIISGSLLVFILQFPVKFLVFRSGLGDLSFLWEYVVESLCNRFRIFRDYIVVPKRREPITQ